MSARWGRPLVRLGVCASTNEVARWLAAAGLPEGTAVIAQIQTRGRGRHGRIWSSPAGGLWCSLLLRPAAQTAWGRLSLAASVATAEAIERTANVRAAIRWPNDVLVEGRKVAGILLEAAAHAVIAGIGINANVATADLPPVVRGRAGSLHELSGHAISLETLFETLRERFARWYALWSSSTDAAVEDIIEGWSARDATRGQQRGIQIGSQRVEGIAEGVDATGALRVRARDGLVRTVTAGDIVSPPVLAGGDGRIGYGDI